MLSRRGVLLVATATGLAVFSAAGFAADFKLNLANVSGANSLPAMADQIFAKAVAEKSGGRIEVVTHPGGALGYKERDQYTAVEDGAVEIANTPFDKLVGLAPIFELQSLPFLTPTIPETKTMLDVAKPWYEKAFNNANQTLLFGAPYTPQGIWARKLIKGPEDLKGLKVRTYDVTSTRTFQAAGAQPIQLSWADVPSSLSTNVVEAVLTSDESGVSARFWDQGVKYFNFLGYTMGIGAVTMNLKKFNALPPDLQKAVRDAAAQAEKQAWEMATSRVGENKKTMVQNGAVFVEDVPAVVIDHLKKAGAPRLDDWRSKQGPDADKILAEFKAKKGS
jgi:TRAP-type transport system periplasmic protein